MTLIVRACAKINLTLRVLGTRADGYHELRTTFQSLALHDTLELSRGVDRFTIECTDPEVPTDASNLVWKAAALVGRRLPRRLSPPRGGPAPVRVRLIKRIPAQAGLGGGSSDAAATLRALDRLYGLALPHDELTAMARTLGADVPFFLQGGTALGVERGDVLFPLADLSPAWVVVARPPFGVSTADAYRWWDEANRSDQSARTVVRKDGDRLAELPASELGNDLEPPVAVRHPEIARFVRLLRRAGARYAAMSGSGSAVFGFYDDKREAGEAAGRCIARGAAALVTKTLSRGSFARVSRIQAEPGVGDRRGGRIERR
jgi:4-diphosphocytidyl-2-C-methyl-D-erythritol kinase